MKYCGIGSRKTPNDILKVMYDFASVMAVDADAILRSGAAEGADSAFEFGADVVDGKTEIYLPWRRFNGCLNVELDSPTDEAMALAAQYHPGWQYLKRPVKLLIARNGHQVLGRDLNDPVDLIVCWTPDGSLDGTGSKSGGTGQALRIATDYQIPVYNLQRDEHLRAIQKVFEGDEISRRHATLALCQR